MWNVASLFCLPPFEYKEYKFLNRLEWALIDSSLISYNSEDDTYVWFIRTSLNTLAFKYVRTYVAREMLLFTWIINC